MSVKEAAVSVAGTTGSRSSLRPELSFFSPPRTSPASNPITISCGTHLPSGQDWPSFPPRRRHKSESVELPHSPSLLFRAVSAIANNQLSQQSIEGMQS